MHIPIKLEEKVKLEEEIITFSEMIVIPSLIKEEITPEKEKYLSVKRENYWKNKIF